MAKTLHVVCWCSVDIAYRSWSGSRELIMDVSVRVSSRGGVPDNGSWWWWTTVAPSAWVTNTATCRIHDHRRVADLWCSWSRPAVHAQKVHYRSMPCLVYHAEWALFFGVWVTASFITQCRKGVSYWSRFAYPSVRFRTLKSLVTARIRIGY